MQELCGRRPGSQVVQTPLSTLCQRVQAVDTWISEAILQLLDYVEAAALPDHEKNRLSECLGSLSTATSQVLTLSHGSQKVHNLPACLAAQDWSRQLDSTVMDHLDVLAKRLAWVLSV